VERSYRPGHFPPVRRQEGWTHSAERQDKAVLQRHPDFKRADSTQSTTRTGRYSTLHQAANEMGPSTCVSFWRERHISRTAEVVLDHSWTSSGVKSVKKVFAVQQGTYGGLRPTDRSITNVTMLIR